MHAAARGALFLVALQGCDAVPALTFAQGDAAIDVTEAATVDVEDADDEPTRPAGPDASPPEAGTADGECPGALPPGASVCCGTVGCDLNCLPALCTMCEQTCAGQLCCAKKNNVMCLPLGSVCH
jgi:hypothetical protein